MTATVQNILQSYELLPNLEKLELAAEIIRRSLKFNLPNLSDEGLVLNAEEIFLELDRREAKNGKSKSRRSMAGRSRIGGQGKTMSGVEHSISR